MEPCSQSDLLREMHGDIKSLVTEFRSMNGSLRETKSGFTEHKVESKLYRSKVDTIWSALHTVKWAIILLFGSGVVWKVLEVWVK